VIIGLAVVGLSTSACSGGSHVAASTSATSVRSTKPATPSSSAPSAAATTRHTAAQRRVDPLTGGRLSRKPVIAVKLENTQAAMPQIGLSRADLVFVEEVEGGLTRLMPIYHSSFPKRIEPVRSARSTDISLLPMFGHPTLVYSGVASQVRKRLKRAPIRLDDSGTRDPSRVAPHNLYFNLARVARQSPHGKPKSIGLDFAKTDPRLHNALRRTHFTVRIGSDRFSFAYKGSRYLPSWNGRPYTDSSAKRHRVTANNVLVLKVREVSDGYRDPAGTPVYRSVSTGSGVLALYRNGKKLSGTWHRAAANKPFRLKGKDGKQLLLSPGKTWILLQP